MGSRVAGSARPAYGGAVIAAGVGMLALGLWIGGGRPSTIPGLPSPGPVTVWGLPLVRLILDVSAAMTVGILVTAAVVAMGRDEETRAGITRGARWWAAAWALSAALTFALTLSDFLGVPVQEALASETLVSFAFQIPQGRAYLLVGGLAAVVAVACAGFGRLPLKGSVRVVLLAVAVFAALPPAYVGHSATAADHNLAVSSLMLHVMAVVVWTGGLAGLLRCLRGSPDLGTAVGRFSALALGCFVAVGVSGAYNAWIRLGTPSALWESTYGLLVLGKLVALVALGWFGVWHRRRTIAALEDMSATSDTSSGVASHAAPGPASASGVSETTAVGTSAADAERASDAVPDSASPPDTAGTDVGEAADAQAERASDVAPGPASGTAETAAGSTGAGPNSTAHAASDIANRLGVTDMATGEAPDSEPERVPDPMPDDSAGGTPDATPSLVRTEAVRRRPFLRLAAGEVVVMAATFGLAVALSRTPPPETEEVFGQEGLLGYALPPIDAVNLITRVRPDPLLLLPLAGAALAYVLGVRRLARAGHRWPVRRTLFWLGGLVVLAYALAGGVAAYAPAMFSIAAAQYALVGVVAPALLVFGAPLTLALAATTPGSPFGALPRVIVDSPVARAVAHPVAAFAVHAVPYLLLFPFGLFGVVQPEHGWRLATQVVLVGTGVVFFTVVAGVDPLPRPVPMPTRLQLLGVAIALHAALALYVMAGPALAASWYGNLALPWAPVRGVDQFVGAVVGLAGTTATLVALIVTLLTWRLAARRRMRRAAPRVTIAK